MREDLLGDIDFGDKVKIEKGSETYKGVLMPHHRFSGDEIVTLKLENGYNIGIETDEGTTIELLEKKKKKDEEFREEIEIDEEKPNISILGTGGTIASYVEYRTGAVHPAQSAEDILFSNPEIAERCDPSLDIILSKLSEDIEPEDWIEIADRVIDEIKSGAEGVVIAHGTDTMGYTAAALSFLLKNLTKPVVLVGSQRSSDRPSSDSHLNLLGAIEVAKSGNPGVFVVMHEDMSDESCSIHRGTKVRKMHTSRRDAFESINCEPLGYVEPEEGKMKMDSQNKDISGELKRKGGMVEDVGFIYANPALKKDDIKKMKDKEGIVIAGTGLGHINSALVGEIEKLIEEDIPVVMSSQCLFGTVNDRVYSTGRKLMEAGVIPGGNMLPETTLVKLMWSLSLDEDTEGLMKTNISRELTDRRVR